MINNFMTALQFLTIFPLWRKEPLKEGELAKSLFYFPVVGFLIGVVLVYADVFFNWVALPPAITNLLLILISVLITRALHIDGLADTLDGLMGGFDAESRLRIMKDSRIGTAGVLGIIFDLSLKYFCLNSLDQYSNEKYSALLTMPMLSHWAQTIMVYRANYGREQGVGRAFVGHLRKSGLAATTAIALVLSGFIIVRYFETFVDFHTLVLACAVFFGTVGLTVLCRWYVVRKIGGVTGDAIGAVSELNEVLVLFLFVLLLSGR